jgi:hypothetical protein
MRMRTPTRRDLRWPVAVVHFAQGAACAILGLIAALALALMDAQCRWSGAVGCWRSCRHSQPRTGSPSPAHWLRPGGRRLTRVGRR